MRAMIHEGSVWVSADDQLTEVISHAYECDFAQSIDTSPAVLYFTTAVWDAVRATRYLLDRGASPMAAAEWLRKHFTDDDEQFFLAALLRAVIDMEQSEEELLSGVEAAIDIHPIVVRDQIAVVTR